jgi:predicted ATPase
MLESVEFKNFKMLRDAKLSLGPFTLLIGPNASGKSTALDGIALAADAASGRSAPDLDLSRYVSMPAKSGRHESVRVIFHSPPAWVTEVRWDPTCVVDNRYMGKSRRQWKTGLVPTMLKNFRRFDFDARSISAPTLLEPSAELQFRGDGLAVVLDNLRDNHPARFEAVNHALADWLPEYDGVLFDTFPGGMRAIKMRVRGTGDAIKAEDLSQGTLIALALLTLAYLPSPPSLITIEEPDRGIHPRLLRRLQDALYRLSYPESDGDNRPPIQVITTTHSPYFLDLFKDHPEEVVIAEKRGMEATFNRLSDLPDIQEILQDASLGGAWYTGILGGVPAGT